jgi:3-dehydroquinate dehydratase
VIDNAIDKVDNWRENVQSLEKDTPKFAVSYTLQEDEIERSKVKSEEKQEWAEGPMA